jgi:hypothetical protein
MQDLLKRAAEQLELCVQLLEDVWRIGLWSKSDDSSDNRNKRRGLREADWAVADACRQLEAAQSELLPDVKAFLAEVEPLANEVIDTMGDNPQLDAAIFKAIRRGEELAKQVRERL